MHRFGDYDLYIDGRWGRTRRRRYDVVQSRQRASDRRQPGTRAWRKSTRRSPLPSRIRLDPGRRGACRAGTHASQQLSDALIGRGERSTPSAQVEWGCSSKRAVDPRRGPASSVGHAAELALEPAEAPMDAWAQPGTTLSRDEPLGVVTAMIAVNFRDSQRHEARRGTGGRNTLVLKPLLDSDRRAGAGADHRRRDRHPAGGGTWSLRQCRGQQVADAGSTRGHGQLHWELRPWAER